MINENLPKTPGIYKIQNLKNGLMYIGSSVNIQRRIRRHKLDLLRGFHSNQKLSRAWSAHGENSFSFSVIEHVYEKENLLSREQYWLDFYGCYGTGGYNILSIAGSQLGKKRSESTIKKLKEINRGRSPSDEARLKMRMAKLGGKHTQEHKDKISAANTGKKIPSNVIEKRIATISKKPSFSGHVGVNWCEVTKKWRARVKRQGVEKIIGYFSDIFLAKVARDTYLAKLEK